MSIDDALVQGLDPLFATLHARIGGEPVRRLSQRVGFSHPAADQRCGVPQEGLPQGVTTLEQASVFATLAAGGLYAEPYAITRIHDPRGNVVYTRTSRPRRVMNPRHAEVLVQALSEAARRAGVVPPVAGIVGETRQGTDAWFIAVAKQLATAVWVGAPDAGPTATREGRAEAGFGTASPVEQSAVQIFGKTVQGAALTTLEPPEGAAPDGLGLAILPPAIAAPAGERPLPPLPIAGPPSNRPDELKDRVIQALERSGAPMVGAVVEVEGLGRVVDWNGHLPLRAASTQKIFTAGAVLTTLGPERTLQTKLARRGQLLPDGTLVGDLVVLAGGDPDLRSEDLERLAESVSASGIRRVTGGVVVDDTLFNRERVPRGWHRLYVPRLLGPLSAFAVDRNEWRCDPEFLADPATANGEKLKQALIDHGVTVRGKVSLGRSSSGDVTFATHDSPPVGRLVRGMLKHSDSFRAEMLYKHLHNPRTSPDAAYTGQGAKAVSLARAGDGSGLSTQSNATASAEVAWLRELERTPVGEIFRSSLPVACEPGTLFWRLCDVPARGQVRAKTGTLSTVTNLVGYAQTASGRKVWFALLLTDTESISQARQAQDQAVLEIVNFRG